jgi:ATP-dependent DNA helicase RecG
MCKELKESGLPDPEYQIESFMLRCTVKAADVGKAGQSTEQTTLRPGEPRGLESIIHKSLTSLRSRVLARSELAAALGHKSISSRLNLRIRQMLDSGLIEYTLPDKPNSRLQKYRLTPKGQALLVSLSAK